MRINSRSDHLYEVYIIIIPVFGISEYANLVKLALFYDDFLIVSRDKEVLKEVGWRGKPQKSTGIARIMSRETKIPADW